jgi:hypothetical protein
MITGSAPRSLPRAFLLRALHRLIGGLLRHAEMLADLPPVGAGLDFGALVRLGRAARIGARPAVNVGLVDDPRPSPVFGNIGASTARPPRLESPTC